MTFTQHPRLLARIAGAFYLIITACALFAYMYVRGQLVVPGDMAQTAANIVAQEQLWRLGFAAAVIVVMLNLPLGFILFELLKVVNPRVALLALLFIIASSTLEAVNLTNYFGPLLPLTLPEYASAFEPDELQALARGPLRYFGTGFGVSLAYFGVFCLLTGYLIFKSGFFPRLIGVLMIVAGAYYLTNYSFLPFLDLPDIPYIGLLRPTLVAEVALALWLLVVGVNEPKWRAQVKAAKDRLYRSFRE